MKRWKMLTIVLIAVILVASVWGVLWFNFLLIRETFDVPYGTTETRQLNLNGGEHVSIWLWTIPPFSSGRIAMGRVIRFNVTNPDGATVLYQMGIAGTGFQQPLTFVAQQPGTYTMHFENTVGDMDSRTVTLWHRVAPAFFGVSADPIVSLALVAAFIIVLALLILQLVKRTDTSARNSQR